MNLRIGLFVVLSLATASALTTCSPPEKEGALPNIQIKVPSLSANVEKPELDHVDLNGSQNGNTNPQISDLSPQLKKTPILVSQLLQQYHFARHPIDEKTAKEWVESYMKAFDYNHLFFIESDLKKFQEKYAKSLPKRTVKSDLSAAYDIFYTFRQRLDERIDWVDQRLKKPFNFEEDDFYEIDRSKSPWPKNTAEADQIWGRRLKFDLLQERIATKPKEDPPVKTVTKRYQRLKKTAHNYDSEDIIQTYLSSLTELYDPHSQYMSPSTLEDFSIGMKLALVGIGAVLTTEDGYCTVKEIIPGGPADLDGRLAVNDRIVAVAQGQKSWVDIVEMKLRNAVKLIRGKKSTIVRLKIIPADAADPSQQEEIKLVRDKIELTAQQASSQILENKDSNGKTWKLGVIELPSFYGDIGSNDTYPKVAARSTTEDVALLLEYLAKENIDGLVLDLRRNGGGLLDEAIQLTGLFIDRGPVVQVKDNNGKVHVRSDTKRGTLYNGPLIVLTSRHSASASEILAGALQNYGRAIVVGDKSTHGKGTVQAVVELSRFFPSKKAKQTNAGAVKLTIQKFYLPNGHSTQNRGVIPDISLPSHNNYLKIGEADSPNALPWDEIRPARFQENPVETQGMLTELKLRSQNRISESQLFKFLLDDIQRLKKRMDEGTISLNEKKRIEERDSEEKRKELVKAHQKKLAQADKKITHLVIKQPENGAARVEIEDPKEIAAKKKKNTDPKNKDKEDEEETDSYSKDLHLRETLAILTDWLSLQNTPAHALTANTEQPKEKIR